ncbi:hypothetical protein PPTG_14532 [Phytophthora nicotianae INRA-310]|uniref:Uncharacterized protein n=1 Tax=Phytophthora nicotianae (strain INRA-310) TaxID=761204 RepID=W2PWW2_PHYN3|nr:hypothetical protein PPTG_14532 [Phytophthora nicotianae INRA-310]ETN04744.1 hypothetical protein PPTG_14532 [Phytophthora nicotianae INRA-310]
MDWKELATFWNEGYVVGRSKLLVDIFDEALHEVRGLAFAPIFGDVFDESGAGDPKRLQTPIGTLGSAMKKVHGAVKAIVTDTEDQWEMKEASWTALKSLPGGDRQGPHKDFPAFETTKALLTKRRIEASVIVALMPRTRFIVFPRRFGSVVDRDDAKELILDKGDILIFRGDLVHAGAAFDEENVRLHCYVLVKGIHQVENTTEAAAFATYMCENCLLVVESRRALSNHLRSCRSRSEEAENEERDERVHCECHGKFFNSMNSYYQHMRRERLKRLREAEQEVKMAEESGTGLRAESSASIDEQEAESSSEGAGSSDEGEEREDESSAYEGSSSD